MEQVKGAKIYVKSLNYLCGIACIGSGALCLLGGPSGNIYMFFAPFYIAIFGFMMIASDLNIGVIIRNCNFLDKYAGRGFFNIFVAAQILNEISANSANAGAMANTFNVVGTVCGWATMILGLYLVILHCIESDTSINGLKEAVQKQAAKAALKNALS